MGKTIPLYCVIAIYMFSAIAQSAESKTPSSPVKSISSNKTKKTVETPTISMPQNSNTPTQKAKTPKRKAPNKVTTRNLPGDSNDKKTTAVKKVKAPGHNPSSVSVGGIRIPTGKSTQLPGKKKSKLNPSSSQGLRKKPELKQTGHPLSLGSSNKLNTKKSSGKMGSFAKIQKTPQAPVKMSRPVTPGGFGQKVDTKKGLKANAFGAQKAGASLSFDEADAMFGKRTNVKDARDSFANGETSTLNRLGAAVPLHTTVKPLGSTVPASAALDALAEKEATRKRIAATAPSNTTAKPFGSAVPDSAALDTLAAKRAASEQALKWLDDNNVSLTPDYSGFATSLSDSADNDGGTSTGEALSDIPGRGFFEEYKRKQRATAAAKRADEVETNKPAVSIISSGAANQSSAALSSLIEKQAADTRKRIAATPPSNSTTKPLGSAASGSTALSSKTEEQTAAEQAQEVIKTFGKN